MDLAALRKVSLKVSFEGFFTGPFEAGQFDTIALRVEWLGTIVTLVGPRYASRSLKWFFLTRQMEFQSDENTFLQILRDAYVEPFHADVMSPPQQGFLVGADLYR